MAIAQAPIKEQRKRDTGSVDVLLGALDALGRGWSILPVRSKRPVKKYLPRGEWSPLRTKPYTMEQALAIFRDDDTLGFATIGGNGLAVIDVDPRNGGTLDGLDIPTTPTESTPSGGVHLYFSIPNDLQLSSTKLRPGVELIAEGKYAVTAPSRGYAWHDGLSPDDVPLAELPAWALPDTRANTARSRTTRKERHRHPPKNQSGASKEYYLLAPHGFKHSKTVDEPVASSQERAAPRPLRNLTGEALAAWFHRRDVCVAIAKHLGLPTRGLDRGRGASFRCVLPGHDDDHPSASLFELDDGRILYRDWHAHGGKEWYSLPEVAANIAYRDAVKVDEPVTINGPELATWSLRLLVETGFVQPAKVEAVALPDDAPKAAKAVYEGFLSLLSVKWLHSPGEPTTFTWRFSGAWAGLAPTTAQRGMKWLLERGYIRKVGEHNKSRYGKKASVFLPGTEAHIKRKEDKHTPTQSNEPQKTSKAVSEPKKRRSSESEIGALKERLSKARDWIEYSDIWREERALRLLGLSLDDEIEPERPCDERRRQAYEAFDHALS